MHGLSSMGGFIGEEQKFFSCNILISQEKRRQQPELDLCTIWQMITIQAGSGILVVTIQFAGFTIQVREQCSIFIIFTSLHITICVFSMEIWLIIDQRPMLLRYWRSLVRILSRFTLNRCHAACLYPKCVLYKQSNEADKAFSDAVTSSTIRQGPRYFFCKDGLHCSLTLLFIYFCVYLILIAFVIFSSHSQSVWMDRSK